MTSRGTTPEQNEEYRNLRVLEEIERNPRVSQRELASRMGVAVGVANSLVRTLARKGLVKIRGENNRSITYHITKAGLARKAALAAQWTVNTIGFYREVRALVTSGLSRVAAEGHTSIVLLGANDIAELAAIVAPVAGITVLGVYPGGGSRTWNNIAHVDTLDASALHDADAAVVCVEAHEDGYAALVATAHEAGVPLYWIDGASVEPVASGHSDT